MNFINLLKIAWKAILLNKTRAMLTMLGIIIGVASVIAMLAIGEGSKESIKKNISSMGANLITIRPGAGMMGGVRSDPSAMQTLTLADYNTLKSQAKLIKEISLLKLKPFIISQEVIKKLKKLAHVPNNQNHES